MTDTSSELLQEVHDPAIRILRFNRPQAYNALSRDLVRQLREAVKGLASDGTRVVIFTASEPGFCAGADLKERRGMSDDEKFVHNRAINALADEIAALPIPTIAAINGVAMGGGCELSLACDIRYASSDSRIGLTETRIGAMPGAGGTQRLPRLIGSARALELMYAGATVDGPRAEDIGLVNRCFDPKDLEAEALAFARTVAEKSRVTAATLKSTVWRGLEGSLAEGLKLEGAEIVEILRSVDYQEGLAAFAEKRKPRFG
jgi:enoyl-CoA hydratase/carnithine racemase